MPRYTIDRAASRVVVKARSNIHDTETRWSALAGTIDADAADLVSHAAADVIVNMTRYDAGDFLRNRKLRKDLSVDRYREARYRLTRLHDVVDRGGGRFTAAADGTVSWHGREVPVAVSGEGVFAGDELRATVHFDVDVRSFGVNPPRFLMFKVENVVSVEVSLAARRAGD